MMQPNWWRKKKEDSCPYDVITILFFVISFRHVLFPFWPRQCSASWHNPGNTQQCKHTPAAHAHSFEHDGLSANWNRNSSSKDADRQESSATAQAFKVKLSVSCANSSSIHLHANYILARAAPRLFKYSQSQSWRTQDSKLKSGMIDKLQMLLGPWTVPYAYGNMVLYTQSATILSGLQDVWHSMVIHHDLPYQL